MNSSSSNVTAVKLNHSLKPASERHLPPSSAAHLSDEAILDRLKELKPLLQKSTLILGHHYQQNDIIQFADITGDSLELARVAAKEQQKPYIIFCGVHFMAETADMLTGAHQQVLLPDLKAGCSMADMARSSEVQKAWELLASWTPQKIVPITYINCAASLKRFVGQQGGAICTSSNAKKIITWGLQQGEKLLFFPDQHLGRNTCFDLGIPLDEMVVYDPKQYQGGLTAEQVQKAKVILWYGYCSVHQGFKAEHIDHWRQQSPKTKIIVHPECSFEVVQKADLAGSTSFIINYVKQAPAGTSIAIGTEINLVNRLAQQYPQLQIHSLSPYQCLCTTMYRVRPAWLLQSFESILRGDPINVIKVDDETRKYSLLALERMMEHSS